MFYTIILLNFISTNACFFQFLVVQQNFSAYSRSHHFATLDEQQSMQHCKERNVWQHCAREVVIDKNTRQPMAWRKKKRRKSIDTLYIAPFYNQHTLVSLHQFVSLFSVVCHCAAANKIFIIIAANFSNVFGRQFVWETALISHRQSTPCIYWATQQHTEWQIAPTKLWSHIQVKIQLVYLCARDFPPRFHAKFTQECRPRFVPFCVYSLVMPELAYFPFGFSWSPWQFFCYVLWFSVAAQEEYRQFSHSVFHAIVFANIVVVVVLVVVGLVLCLGRATLKIIFVHGRV